MKVTIINSTNRAGNKSLEISKKAEVQAVALGHEAAIVDLTHFTELFTDKHLTLETADLEQKKDLLEIMTADVLLFVVPTYHSGIPGSFKNFLDLISCKSCFEGKVIGIISSNNKNQDLGARQAQQILNGMLSFQNAHSFIVPRITIINHDQIDEKRLREFIKTCTEFTKAFSLDTNKNEALNMNCIQC